MCTVTVVPAGATIRLACNRDELRSRPAALPPRVRQLGPRRAVLPIDPASGGTWVAVNEAGLALTLLNVNPVGEGGEKPVPKQSRGTIIPGLLSVSSLASALSQAAALDATDYAPFRLVLADHEGWAELRSDGRHVRLVGPTAIAEPLLFTSSGLGDHLVEGPRRRLFAEWFRGRDDLAARQETFHRHHWPDRPHLSVCMRRRDARTVSYTVISLGPDDATLSYHADAPDRPAPAASVRLSRTEAIAP